MPAGDACVKYRFAIDTMFRRYHGHRGTMQGCAGMCLLRQTSAMRLASRAPADASAELFG
jgi:hypothetical protein